MSKATFLSIKSYFFHTKFNILSNRQQFLWNITLQEKKSPTKEKRYFCKNRHDVKFWAAAIQNNTLQSVEKL